MSELEQEIRTESDLPLMPEEGCDVHLHDVDHAPLELGNRINHVIRLKKYELGPEGLEWKAGSTYDDSFEPLLGELHRSGYRLTKFGPRPNDVFPGMSEVPPIPVAMQTGLRMDLYIWKAK